MPKRKEAEEFAVVGEKDCWHLYGLQVLSPNKFVTVVGRILQGRYWLINPGIPDKTGARLS
ncbi:MAG TPA: hypothetical protein VMY05_04120 [Acidobacteriota bacterium]|nr:hypothetical protein [Acidobacteriota bacterium]